MTEVFVSSHIKIDFKLPAYCRLIQVGCAGHDKIDGYLHDDWNGEENISAKNQYYCELTALYCLWKHCNADIKGLYHYRRMFYAGEPLSCNKRCMTLKAENIQANCLTEEQITKYLEECDVIDEIPYCPTFTTVEQDLAKYCFQEDIEKLKKIMEQYFPDDYNILLDLFQTRHISYCNMLITRREIMDDYCTWLFSILEKCEEVIDPSGYDQEHKRIYGYFAEVLMNVYIKKHQLREKHVPLLFVFEYTTNMKHLKWLDWQWTNFLQLLEKKHIPIPNRSTMMIRSYQKLIKEKQESVQNVD